MDSKMTQKIGFTKMHGAGNDYIYVNSMLHDIPDPVHAAIFMSDRHKGIGSDGLVLIGNSPVPEADFSMRIFNADGSEAMMCGNASRCIGKYLYERGLTDKLEIRLLTLSGVKTLSLHVDDGIVSSVTVDMGEPVFDDETQFLSSRDIKKGVFVSMGNPHYVIFTDDVDQVTEIGRTLEYHPAFPQRCNIELAHIEVDGRAGRQSQIVMDGGTLRIEWRESDNHVYMSGPAEFVFDGEIELNKLQTT